MSFQTFVFYTFRNMTLSCKGVHRLATKGVLDSKVDKKCLWKAILMCAHTYTRQSSYAVSGNLLSPLPGPKSRICNLQTNALLAKTHDIRLYEEEFSFSSVWS